MEFVLVVPRAVLFPDCAPHGLAVFGEEWSRERFDRAVREHGYFVERAHAETDPTLKQVIPYTVVVRRDAAADAGAPGATDRTEVLLLARTKRGGDARLHEKLSIGVGGHVNPVDAIDPEDAGGRLADPLPAATRREVMEEELEVSGATRLTPVGLINDDTNAVGAVHVGLVQILELLGGDARVREVDQLEGSFVTLAELRERADAGDRLETWSSLLVPRLAQVLESTQLLESTRRGPHAAHASAAPADRPVDAPRPRRAAARNH